jgi:hypothetical protein
LRLQGFQVVLPENLGELVATHEVEEVRSGFPIIDGKRAANRIGNALECNESDKSFVIGEVDWSAFSSNMSATSGTGRSVRHITLRSRCSTAFLAVGGSPPVGKYLGAEAMVDTVRSVQNLYR